MWVIIKEKGVKETFFILFYSFNSLLRGRRG